MLTDADAIPLWNTWRERPRRRGSPWSHFTALGSPWSQLDPAPEHREFVVQTNGMVRQAGADLEGAWVTAFRQKAERSLYVFMKSVLNRRYLTPSLHLPFCTWLQAPAPDPNRKCAQIFREGGKSSIASHGIPLHIHIQPKAHNVYFPGELGTEQRILLVCETIERSRECLRVVQTDAESNELLRSLWPERFWDDPYKQAKRWSSDALIHPRLNEYPDPSLAAIGVGGAIAGKHPRVIIRDDPISFEAANSPTTMANVIAWHTASRALINTPGCLEFTIGTPWGVHDLYSEMKRTDSRDQGGTVDFYIPPLIGDDGICVYPEFLADDGKKYGFSDEKIAHLRATMGPMFMLQYQITAVDPSLTDFQEQQLRWYTIEQEHILFDEDARDVALRQGTLARQPPARAVQPGVAWYDQPNPEMRRRAFLKQR